MWSISGKLLISISRPLRCHKKYMKSKIKSLMAFKLIATGAYAKFWIRFLITTLAPGQVLRNHSAAWEKSSKEWIHNCFSTSKRRVSISIICTSNGWHACFCVNSQWKLASVYSILMWLMTVTISTSSCTFLQPLY